MKTYVRQQLSEQKSIKLFTAHAAFTVYALTFARLNFHGFRGSVAIRKSFIPRKFRPDGQGVSGDVTNRENENAKSAKLLIWESLTP